MMAGSNFTYQLITVITWIFDVAILVFVIRALLSWVDAPPYNLVVKFINRVTEPILKPIRKVVPLLRFGHVMIDLSIIAVFLGLSVLKWVIITSLISFMR